MSKEKNFLYIYWTISKYLILVEDSDYIKFIIEYFEVVKDKSKFLESILVNLSCEQIVAVFENLKEDYVSNMC